MMGFGLLVPAFMLGLATLILPVVLHLRHRDKNRPQKFPSLMFLEHLPTRTTERRRITDWPLLLLRLLVLALLVTAFARPVVSRPAVIERAKRARAVVLLLDRSMSMGHRDVWPAAVDSARRIILGLGTSDRVALVLFDDDVEIVQPFTIEKRAALAALAKAKPGPRGTRYAAALRAARQLIARAGDAAGDVVIVSDLQRSGVSGVAGLDLPEGLPVRVIGVGARSTANTSVSSVEVRRIVEPLRTMVVIQTRVISRDLRQSRRLRATLMLNGRTRGTRDVTVPLKGDVPVAFDPVLLPTGLVRGAIAIDNDALAADDTVHFAFTANDVVKVVLVVPEDAQGDETLFFERALAVSRMPVMRIERVRARGGRINARALDGAGLVLLWDTPPPTGSAASVLTEFVRRGGGLAVAAGPRYPATVTASALLPASVNGSADRFADRGGSLGDVRLDHPLYAIFRDSPSALSNARFLRYPRFEPAVGTEVIARFDDGLPAVLERREGMGRILVLGTALDTRTGDFPLQSAYLPFLQRLVLYTSGRDATTLWRTTGQSWLLPGSLKEAAVSTPGGSIIRPIPDSVGSTVALRESGIYALYDGRVQGEPAAVLAVNAPTNESDLTPMDARELLLGVRQSAATTNPAGDVPTRAEVEGRQRIWRMLLVAVALALLIEMIVANRGWRGMASRLVVPSGRRTS